MEISAALEHLSKLPEPEISQNQESSLLDGIFTIGDVDALIAIALGDHLEQWDELDERRIHAWRNAAQVATATQLDHFLELAIEIATEGDLDVEDFYFEDYVWIMQRMGPDVINRLIDFAGDPQNDERIRISTLNALKKFALQNERAENIWSQMKTWLEAKEPERGFNAFLVMHLLENQADSSKELILAAYEANLVDVMMNGDREQVEIELGLREERETEQPHLYQLEARLAHKSLREQLGPVPSTDNPPAVLEYFIHLYRTPRSVTDFAMLDGLLLVLINAPQMVMPTTMLSLMWDCEEASPDATPEFDSKDFELFSAAFMAHYNGIIKGLDAIRYMPGLYMIEDEDGKNVQISTKTWSVGLITGSRFLEINQGPSPYTERVNGIAADLIAESIGEEFLDEEKAVEVLTPALEFFHLTRAEQQAGGKRFSSTPTEQAIREDPKIGRNDPCPCGSGRKYKKCCAN